MLSKVSTLNPNFKTFVRVQPVGTKAKLYNWRKKMNDSGYLSKDVRSYCLWLPTWQSTNPCLTPRHFPYPSSSKPFFSCLLTYISPVLGRHFDAIRVLFVISRNLRTWTLIDDNESLGTELANYSAQWSFTSFFFYLCLHTAIEFVSSLLLWFLPPPPFKMEFASTIWDCA